VSHPHPELSLPPKLPAGGLRIVALGGLGEVGRNMAVLEHEGRLLIIDCGVLFPEDHQPGVDLILPDFEYIADRLDDIDGIVLTHGHEDHIGAVPYLLRLRRDIPLYGSQLTLAFVDAKLKEHRIRPVLRVVREGDTAQVGVFSCEFVAVNHSIPDALAVAVTTAAGTVLHTGDFKMDQLPLDGRVTDLRAFARLGEKGVDLFMVDSTNAEVPGFVTNEVEIGPVLDNVFAQAEKRIVVASFSSHVHRVQQVLNAAHAHGRKVALAGRSMIRNMGIAAELGYLDVPPGVLIDMKKADQVPDHELVYMCTGSLIPGNENSVFRVINGLTRLGARVVHSGNAKVHVSGHASAGELLYCYNILRPKNVMPVHGEVRHLVANAALAVRTGVPADRVVLAEDGVVVDLVDGKASVVGAVPCGYVYVDGSSVGEVTENELKDRRTLGEEGFVSVFAVVSTATGKVLAGPQILVRGMAEDAAVFDEIRPEVVRALEDSVAGGATDTYQLQQVMRRVIGQWVNRRLRRRPMIVPVVVEA
jgi:ribonuclease J